MKEPMRDMTQAPEIALWKLREMRGKECFALVDGKSPLFWKRYNEEQEAQLDIWHQAWLDVTKTGVIPQKPDFL